jgi:hypothetical protein
MAALVTLRIAGGTGGLFMIGHARFLKAKHKTMILKVAPIVFCPGAGPRWRRGRMR